MDLNEAQAPPWRRRLSRLGTTPLDVGLAAAFCVVGLAQAVLFPIADQPLGVIYVIGSMLPLAWWRTRPLEAALVASAFWLIPLDGYPLMGFVVVILQFYGVGSHGTPRRAVVLVTAWAAVASVVGTLIGPEPAVAAIGGVLAVVAPVLVGQVVARLRTQNQALARLTGELRAERERSEEAAVGAERARIAQELHDVVGHEVTLIAIQAEAAGAALRLDPSRAAEPVEAIRSTAHRTLAEIREVMNVLSPDGAPSGEDLADLTRRARDAGIDNSLRVTGEPWATESPVTLAVARIVRECLTNAGRHAPGHALDLSVTWSPDTVVVEAVNRGAHAPVAAPGRGLTGIRHRAELLGGSYHAHVRDGEFSVRVMLPSGASSRAGGDR